MTHRLAPAQPAASCRGRRRPRRHLVLLFAVLASSGCASVEYAALEKVGIHKRDILVDRVEEARDAQDDTRQKVVSAYSELNTLLGLDGGELAERHARLDKEVSRAERATGDLDDKLAAIDRVSDDLFEEWEGELAEYTSDRLREDQRRRLGIARRQYAGMRERMQAARDRVDPVLAVLKDNVLFLKHSLNAQALTALRGQAATLEGQVDALIQDMQRAIEEADAFIANLRAPD